jgi:hypothetical protein
MLSQWDFYSALPLSVPPIFFAVSGLFWGSLGLWLAVSIWLRSRWATKATRWAAVAYATFSLLDRALLQVDGPGKVTWRFDLFLTILLLALVFSTLALPQTKRYFGANDE